MGSNKPSIPKGTRDFGPEEMAKRNYIFNTIKEVYALYGFQQIETPAMETLHTLLGKYGDEGDKLLFKILNSGEAFAGVDAEELSHSNALSLKVCEKGLRYDLTVPFARYVVQHQNEITFPFKRFQIQPVWRADRPQKGRYREFYQCDVDVIGSQSQINELELVQIADEVFRKLDINVCIKINNRKVLQGLAEIIGHPDKLVDITVAIDKIDKIGLQAVKEELAERGIDSDGIAILEPILQMQGTNREKLAAIRTVLSGRGAAQSSTASEVGLKGVDELEELFNYIESASIKQKVEIDLSLARGLNYYTGAIFEIQAEGLNSSIAGGGRYDHLIGMFSGRDIPAVGISLGFERICVIMQERGMFQDVESSVDVVVAPACAAALNAAFEFSSIARNLGFSAEVYPGFDKLAKQFKYANERKATFVAVFGEDELAQNAVTVKNMTTSEQKTMKIDEVESFMKCDS